MTPRSRDTFSTDWASLVPPDYLFFFLSQDEKAYQIMQWYSDWKLRNLEVLLRDTPEYHVFKLAYKLDFCVSFHYMAIYTWMISDY